MSAYLHPVRGAHVLAVSTSPGGIPKLPRADADVRQAGIVGDGRNHTKHIRPDRAVSLWDFEILQRLKAEGFPSLVPGAAGENLTVVGLSVQSLPPGTLLGISTVVLKLEQPRKPCYVLDAIDPQLKDAVVGRCGYLASVVQEGTIRPGMSIEVLVPCAADTDPIADGCEAGELVSALPGERSYLLMAGPMIG